MPNVTVLREIPGTSVAVPAKPFETRMARVMSPIFKPESDVQQRYAMLAAVCFREAHTRRPCHGALYGVTADGVAGLVSLVSFDGEFDISAEPESIWFLLFTLCGLVRIQGPDGVYSPELGVVDITEGAEDVVPWDALRKAVHKAYLQDFRSSAQLAHSFVRAFNAEGYPELKSLGMEVWLTIADEKTVKIEAIWSHQLRRVGYGRKAMHCLCSLADSLGVRLTLTVHPLYYGELEGETEAEALHCEQLDGQVLDGAALEAWYVRLGFTRAEGTDRWNPTMFRQARNLRSDNGL